MEDIYTGYPRKSDGEKGGISDMDYSTKSGGIIASALFP
jgi:hypothetical protein